MREGRSHTGEEFVRFDDVGFGWSRGEGVFGRAGVCTNGRGTGLSVTARHGIGLRASVTARHDAGFRASVAARHGIGPCPRFPLGVVLALSSRLPHKSMGIGAEPAERGSCVALLGSWVASGGLEPVWRGLHVMRRDLVKTGR